MSEHGKQIQEQLQQRLMMLDDGFHNAIIALERLEQFLYVEEQAEDKKTAFHQTAVGSERDIHNDVDNPPTRNSFYMEVQLHCTNLFMQSRLEDKETFERTQKYFLKDLLEWYAGRQNATFNDVDRFFVPLVGALSRQVSDITQVSKTVSYYVCELATVSDYSDDEMANAITDIFGKIYQAQKILEERMKVLLDSGVEIELTQHQRGSMQEGYQHLKSAFSELYPEDIAPQQILDKQLIKYYPELSEELGLVEIPRADILAEETSQTDAPSEEVPQVEVLAEEAPQVEAPAEEAPQAEVPAEEAPQADAPSEEASQADAPAKDAPKKKRWFNR